MPREPKKRTGLALKDGHALLTALDGLASKGHIQLRYQAHPPPAPRTRPLPPEGTPPTERACGVCGMWPCCGRLANR